MAATQKVSVSIERAQLRWAKALSKKTGVSVSSLLSEALRLYREEKARELAARELLSKFSSEDRATPDEAAALLGKWQI
jgi:hypothetical protein